MGAGSHSFSPNSLMLSFTHSIIIIMPKFSRLAVYQKLHDYPVIPLLTHTDVEACKQIMQACYNGGVRVFEFTNRSDFAHETFAQLSRFAHDHFTDLVIGAGTIVDAGTAALYIQLGADFIVAPNLVPEVGRVCNRRKIGWIPGVATLSEISQAEEMGVEIVKVFPGQVLTPNFVKALKAPLPWTSVMATGGVEPTQESLSKWFGAGVTCVGLGSQLFPKELLDTGDWAALEARIRDVMTIVSELKK